MVKIPHVLLTDSELFARGKNISVALWCVHFLNAVLGIVWGSKAGLSTHFEALIPMRRPPVSQLCGEFDVSFSRYLLFSLAFGKPEAFGCCLFSPFVVLIFRGKPQLLGFLGGRIRRQTFWPFRHRTRWPSAVP